MEQDLLNCGIVLLLIYAKGQRITIESRMLLFSKSDSATQGQIVGNGVFDLHIWSGQQFLLKLEPFHF